MESGKDHSKAAEPPEPDNRNVFHKNLISFLEPHSYEAEQFKILRTSILFPIAGEVPTKSILITSAMPGEGKSFVAANLAVSIALNINKHVLLIDCDIRKPDIHQLFGIGNVPGLTEYLRQKSELAPLLVRTAVDRLTVLPGGEPSLNASELMSSERMAELIEEVKHRYPDRLIVIDSPPTNLAAETGFLAREVDGILVVAKHGKTPQQDVAELLELLGSDKIIGFVLNRMGMALKRQYGFKYSGKYRGYYK
ncbi:MAG: polysaccharide biosynthesis tyrosine autokinase [bacterium]|nr:polysaccharide biosynthesis tyrosine autokinase [bacterium]